MSGYDFDQLIKDGETVEALRYFAKEGYQNGDFGHTRKQLIEYAAEQIEDQQAELDTLSMAHDEVHRLLPLDKHTLIKSVIELNRQVRELNFHVDENSEKHAELNVFLQERNTNTTIGMHVVDAIKKHVKELEYVLEQDRRQEVIEVLYEENKRYREVIDKLNNPPEEHEYTAEAYAHYVVSVLKALEESE